MKSSINDEWIKWIKSQLNNKVSVDMIKEKLLSQNYSAKLIDDVLKSIIHNKSYSEFYVKNKGFYEISTPENTTLTTTLEIGDYVPYFNVSNKKRHLDISEMCSKKYCICFWINKIWKVITLSNYFEF